MIKNILFIKKYLIEIILVTLSLIFSFWLMFHTFSYSDGAMYIATKAWSDFASHIPLIRSFSLGDNIPPEFPLFSGEPIRYHFLFYALVGFLEKLGLRIDYALNIPSALSFTLLLIMIYFFAKTLFKRKAIGMLSVIFFLFNGSFSFVYFFQKNHFDLSNILLEITQNEIFPAFAPYDGTLISGGFWNLNVFTNQRHFALPLALVLFMVWVFLRYEEKMQVLPKKLSFIFGVILGVLSSLHGAVFLMSVAIQASLFVFFPKQRKSIFIIGIVTFLVSLPRTLFLFGVESQSIFKFSPGYLIINDLSFYKWLRYWILNLGLGTVLIPLGVILSKRRERKIFLAFSSLFVIGNLFQFSPDIATNHKFFNLWIIVANMFTVFLLTKLWEKGFFQKAIVVIFIFFLTFSGVIDFFPIKNDRLYPILDYPKNPDVLWIVNRTKPDSIFLNSTYLYHPASLAGRKIFLGWPYFSWSLGYDTYKRDAEIKNLFMPKELEKVCSDLFSNNLSYVTIHGSQNDFPVNNEFFRKHFKVEYKNPQTDFAVYNIKESCKAKI